MQNNVTDAGDYIARLGEVFSDGPILIVDSKRRERVRLIEWSRQIEAVSGAATYPAVAYRPNHEPWRISLRLEDFARLLGNGNE